MAVSLASGCVAGPVGCERHSSTAMLDLRSVQSACIAPQADTRAQVSHAFIRLVLRCTLQRAPQLPAKNSRAVCTWTVSRRSMRRAGSSVVAHSCSGIISPRPCSETCRAQALGFGFESVRRVQSFGGHKAGGRFNQPPVRVSATNGALFIKCKQYCQYAP